MTAIAKPKTLFDIGEEWKRWHQLMDETGGELAPEDEAAITAWHADLEENEATKVGQLVGVIKLLESEVDAAGQWAEFFFKKKVARERRIADIKRRLLDYMADNERTALVSDRGVKVVMRNNSTKPLLVNGKRIDEVKIVQHDGHHFIDCLDGSELTPIDEVFVKTKIELNAALAHEAVKNKTAPAVFEHGHPGVHLRIM